MVGWRPWLTKYVHNKEKTFHNSATCMLYKHGVYRWCVKYSNVVECALHTLLASASTYSSHLRFVLIFYIFTILIIAHFLLLFFLLLLLYFKLS